MADEAKTEAAAARQVAYADLVMRVTQTPGIEWDCPACGERLRIENEQAISTLAKGGSITDAECIKCKAKHDVGRRLVDEARGIVGVHPNSGPNRHARRGLVASGKLNGGGGNGR